MHVYQLPRQQRLGTRLPQNGYSISIGIDTKSRYMGSVPSPNKVLEDFLLSLNWGYPDYARLCTEASLHALRAEERCQPGILIPIPFRYLSFDGILIENAT